MQPASSTESTRRSGRPSLALGVGLAALLALVAAGATLAIGGFGDPEFHATAYLPPQPAADFTLTDHTGTLATLSELRGTPVLLFFGYTHCPDVCPMTLSLLRDAMAEVGAGPEDARVLLVTVDPVRDTPEVLARYVERYGANVTGLTGSEDQIRKLLADYGVHAEAGHGEAGLLSHTSAVFGIDSQGMIRVLLRPDAPREELEADVATLLEL